MTVPFSSRVIVPAAPLRPSFHLLPCGAGYPRRAYPWIIRIIEGSLKIIGLLQFLQDKVKLCHSIHIAVDAQKPNDLSFMLDKNVDETKFLFLLRPL